MSIGLAFVKGLVGGFSKNIEREREARGAEDARIAELENFMFEAATNPKKRVPEELGNILRDAKTQVADRGPIDILGRPSDRLNLDMTRLKTMVDEADDDKKFLTFGKIKMPISAEYGKGKSPVAESKMILDAMANWTKTLSLEKIQETKNYFKSNNDIYQDFYNQMRSSGEGYARGFSKFINPEKEESLIAQMPIYAQHNILKRVWEDDVPQLMSDDEKTYKAAKISLTQSTKKDSSKMKIAAKNAILLPFQTNEEDGTLTFLPFKFDEKKAQDAQILKSIAKLNDYGDDVGLFVTAYRRQSQQTLPVVGNLNEISMDTFPDYFPRLKHAIELYKRGAWKKQENIKAEEVRNIVGYLNNSSNFNQEGSLAKLSALALIQPVEEEDLITSKYANYKMLKFDKTKVDAKRNEIFKRFTGATVDDFNVRFDANTDVVTKLTKYVRNDVNETTSPGGFVRGLKKTFGALAAPSGQVAQLVQFIAGTDKRYNVSQGGLKKGTTFATLEAIVRKIKDEGGIEAELSAIKENEGLMIVLAANMARALDPAGRLSNQDFEVQLKRLGDSGFFGTKAGSLRSLKSVVDEFNTQFKKLEAFKVIADNSSRGFSRPQLQILKANKVFDSMETRTRVLFGENKGGGIVTFDESKTQTLNSLIGPNGGPTTIKIDTNGKEHFFEGNVKVPRSFYNESQGSGVNQNNNTGQNLKPNNQIENNQEQQTITVKSSDIMGGTNSTGFILRGMEGRYRQLPDGSFTRIK